RRIHRHYHDSLGWQVVYVEVPESYRWMTCLYVFVSIEKLVSTGLLHVVIRCGWLGGESRVRVRTAHPTQGMRGARTAGHDGGVCFAIARASSPSTSRHLAVAVEMTCKSAETPRRYRK